MKRKSSSWKVMRTLPNFWEGKTLKFVVAMPKDAEEISKLSESDLDDYADAEFVRECLTYFPGLLAVVEYQEKKFTIAAMFAHIIETPIIDDEFPLEEVGIDICLHHVNLSESFSDIMHEEFLKQLEVWSNA